MSQNLPGLEPALQAKWLRQNVISTRLSAGHVQLPIGQTLQIHINIQQATLAQESPFTKLLAIASKAKIDPSIPQDAAARHNHF